MLEVGRWIIKNWEKGSDRHAKHCIIRRNSSRAKSDILIPHISHVENARTTLSVDFLVKASNALHVSADQLLCDSLKYTNDVYKGEIVEALEDCSQTELMIISQTVMDLKRNLRKNIGVDDEEGTVG